MADPAYRRGRSLDPIGVKVQRTARAGRGMVGRISEPTIVHDESGEEYNAKIDKSAKGMNENGRYEGRTGREERDGE